MNYARKTMLGKVLVAAIASGAFTVPLCGVATAEPMTDSGTTSADSQTDPGATSADSAKPENPSGYSTIVSSHAREDHDNWPGPGNVVGGRRGDVAPLGPGDLRDLVNFVKDVMGTQPNPPGQN